MAFIDSLKRYSDIPVLFSVLLGFLFGTFDIRLSEALTPWLQPTSWQGLVAQVCGLQVVHGGAYLCSLQVCVISPLATVKSLFRSPSGSRPGTFLCKS